MLIYKNIICLSILHVDIHIFYWNLKIKDTTEGKGYYIDPWVDLKL